MPIVFFGAFSYLKIVQKICLLFAENSIDFWCGKAESLGVKTKAYKIRRAARIIAKGYIKTLAQGKEPMFLRAQIELGKYDILENVNDDRLNISDTLEAVRIEAANMIKSELDLRLDLKQRLVDFRRKREEEARKKDSEQIRKNNLKFAQFFEKKKTEKKFWLCLFVPILCWWR